ncbi:glycoprotein-N-acetylgalactosamine 3-beta-galactosyltransferase [Aureococcus anophagefferens]|nr:glycoprotein-N-acetylgalactosamine 3-beta-galactosyltransferase [Aureococcus anophagefferens]
MDTVVGPKMRKAWFCTFENLVFDGAKWRAFCDLTRWGRDRRYLEDLPWAFGRDVLVSSGAPPASTPKKSRPTYVAFGDCRTGNPGHCIGDWQNYRIVSRVLNESSFDAILFAGFGDGRWRGEWDAVVEPEAAVYATGALSPLGMHGPHWQVGHYLLAARARPGCRGRPPPSPVLVDVTTRDGRGGRRLCGLVRAKRVRAAGAPCGASAFVFLYVLRPARRTGGDATPLREISNVDDLLAAVEGEHPTAAVVAADFMRLSPVEQEAAVRRADVVFGTHGGGLWNAARWMRPPQALLEIMPAGGPGSTEHIAHGLGVAYYEVRCDACTRATGFSGDVSIRKTKKTYKEVDMPPFDAPRIDPYRHRANLAGPLDAAACDAHRRAVPYHARAMKLVDVSPVYEAPTDESDETVGAVGVPHEGPEEYNNIWQKTRANWRYVYEYYRDDFDYFHFGGDDLFLLVSNLKAYLASPPVKARNDRGEPLGYTFNRQSLALLYDSFDEPFCQPHLHGFYEDVMVAECFRNGPAHLLPTDTRDATGAERFHPFTPGHHLLREPEDWYAKYSFDLIEGEKYFSRQSRPPATQDGRG